MKKFTNAEILAAADDYVRRSKKKHIGVPPFDFLAGARWVIKQLKKSEQPEAITEDSHLRKHDVGRSAASDDISNKGNDPSESSSETQAVGQNEQTKEVKKAVPFGIALLRAKQHYRNTEDDNIPF